MQLIKQWEEYRSLVSRTEVSATQIASSLSNSEPLDISSNAILKIRFMHGCVGLCTEIGELWQGCESGKGPNWPEELGDVCWYLGTINNALSLVLPNTIPPSLCLILPPTTLDPFSGQVVTLKLNRLAILANCMLLDQAKKYMFYNQTPDWNVTLLLLGMCLDLVNELVRLVHRPSSINVTIEAIWDANIAKLAARYPDKFTEHSAKNRNLSAEQTAMDSKLI